MHPTITAYDNSVAFVPNQEPSTRRNNLSRDPSQDQVKVNYEDKDNIALSPGSKSSLNSATNFQLIVI